MTNYAGSLAKFCQRIDVIVNIVGIDNQCHADPAIEGSQHFFIADTAFILYPGEDRWHLPGSAINNGLRVAR